MSDINAIVTKLYDELHQIAEPAWKENKTAAYMKGSRCCLELATRHRADAVLLKDKSPACGSSFVYSGDFSSTLKEGRGVTAELLHENGFRIFSENDIPLLVNYLQNSNN